MHSLKSNGCASVSEDGAEIRKGLNRMDYLLRSERGVGLESKSTLHAAPPYPQRIAGGARCVVTANEALWRAVATLRAQMRPRQARRRARPSTTDWKVR